MVKRTLCALMIAGVTAGPAFAQAKPSPPAQAKTEKPEKALAEVVQQPQGQSVNIKIDLTITDHDGRGEPAKRTVSMIVADRMNGSIRSSAQVIGGRVVILNVDASPVILRDGALRLGLALEYLPKPTSEAASSGATLASLNERLTLIVTPGKPMIISQAADPTSDRKIAVEVLATLMK
jgi:hypothetical protein